MDYSEMSNQSKLLLLASIIGTFLAIYSIVDSNKNYTSLPDDVVAIVNDKIIPTEKYQIVLELIANDKRNDLTKEDKKMALDRIIEEELLVQYAYQNGFLEADDLLRKSIVRSVVDSIVEQAIAVMPKEKDLRLFFSENSSFFTIDEQFRIVIFSSKNEDDIKKAKRIWEESYDTKLLFSSIGTVGKMDLPSGFISKMRLGNLIGPLLRELVLSLRVGETSPVIKTIYGYSIITLIDKKNQNTPEFEIIKDVVIQEYRRRQREDILDDLLNTLKKQSDLSINERLID